MLADRDGKDGHSHGVRDTGVDLERVWDWGYWEEVTGLTGAALVLYLILSEGSRLYPPRNLAPVP